ncbi:mitochondrial protein Pet127-domain-containing protein [Bipolaris maydis]|uniref:mitochondrial protein Pet127-domain-containing protein n=1 Tax=Cochliobolus heterostrophus TaxID=5016 RepID=UPI0024DA012B|nr:mitochondrial protein Pet127-domain-containing protein [Bipolaris maydis]KAJ6271822.1 mitochondrial protein Pet127-domain-containing protein [Bipolaris maydis]
MRPMAEVGGSLVPSPRVLNVAPMRHVTALIGDCPALTKQNADRDVTKKAAKSAKAKKAAKASKKSKNASETEETEDGAADKHGDDIGISLKDALLGRKPGRPRLKAEEREKLNISSIQTSELKFEPVPVGKPPVPMLAYGLDRVLFNPGVYRLQDPRSRVYNFDPYLERIMPAHEFDFKALSEYKTSSKDKDLLALTKDIGAKFTGSTSSMSGILQHFHFVLSNFRKLNHDMLSRQFPDPSPNFSKITLGPSTVFLRHKDGIYAIDADKSYDRPNIMSWLGHSLEKLLTTERSEFERYRRSNPEQAPAEDNSSRCYHYSKQGNIMMRSQLDAVDPRLPGTGVFDLKTRAVVSIRMNHKEFEEGSGYQLRHALGEWESFEREFYDMTRATLLKYSLQVRMGRMDGIFVAFHNIERIFGFQYLSLSDMDAVLHGQHDTSLGDEEFKVSISLVDEILTKATAQFPDTSLRMHFEAREGKTPFMYIFAEPVTEEQADEIQQAGETAQQDFARDIVGIPEDDRRSQEAWQDIQDDVDEQISEDEKIISIAESSEADASQQEALDASKDASEQVSKEPIEETAEETADETANETAEESTNDGDEESVGDVEDVPEPTSNSEGPLMGWTLSVRNLVNGGYVERPVNFTEQDDWKVEYHIKEIPENARWRLYNALKERRRQLIGLDEEEADKKLKPYRDLISRFSHRGRQWRMEQDQLNESKGVQVFRPLGPGSDAACEHDEAATEKTEETTKVE